MEQAQKFQDLLSDFLSELIKCKETMLEKELIKRSSDELLSEIESLTNQIHG
jgi:hypothetical protein